VYKTSTGETGVNSKSIVMDETFSIGSRDFWCATGEPVATAFMGAFSFPPQCEEMALIAGWSYTKSTYSPGVYGYALKINSSDFATTIDKKFLTFFACQ
jgi:hypothetical protein